MSKYPPRTGWMVLFASLLIPTGLFMATGRFGLAGVCVVLLIVVRVFKLPQQPFDDESERDGDDV